jgi:hypothetical protein
MSALGEGDFALGVVPFTVGSSIALHTTPYTRVTLGVCAVPFTGWWRKFQ